MEINKYEFKQDHCEIRAEICSSLFFPSEVIAKGIIQIGED